MAIVNRGVSASIGKLMDEVAKLSKETERLQPLDEELEGFYCLADGHHHRNRYAEALCSARFQIENLKNENERLRDVIRGLNARLRQAIDEAMKYEDK